MGMCMERGVFRDKRTAWMDGQGNFSLHGFADRVESSRVGLWDRKKETKKGKTKKKTKTMKKKYPPYLSYLLPKEKTDARPTVPGS